MRTIIHLSDFHFGRADTEIAAALQRDTDVHKPDVIVISGDLTQRAKVSEYISSAELINSLSNVKVVVPGNHDIPLYNLWSRFLYPLKRYKKYIQDQIEPVFIDDEITIIGLNTARSFAFKGGRISKKQIDYVTNVVNDSPKNNFKLLVTHHPLEDMWNDPTSKFIDIGIDVFLFGHRHKSNFKQLSVQFGEIYKSSLILQAGTATSTRYRNENNSYTLIKVGIDITTVDLHRWNPETKEFSVVSSQEFKKLKSLED